MSTATTPLLTVEEFHRLPENGIRRELVRGRIVEMNVPTPRHGYLCNRVGRILGNFAEDRGLGRVMNNDAGVVTNRGPDTLPGPDVSYYSYKRLPKGPIPEGYLDVVPELVFEVRSQTDRWDDVLAKISEFLRAGVTVVCLLDEQMEALIVYRLAEFPRTLTEDDELTLPDIFGPDFRVPVSRFFAE